MTIPPPRTAPYVLLRLLHVYPAVKCITLLLLSVLVSKLSNHGLFFLNWKCYIINKISQFGCDQTHSSVLSQIDNSLCPVPVSTNKIATDQRSIWFIDSTSLKSPSKVIISPIFNKGMRFVEGGLLFEEIRCHSAQSVSKLSILRPFVVYFRRVIKLVILPLWPSMSFLLLKSKRTKFILEATTAKKAMFMIERCLSAREIEIILSCYQSVTQAASGGGGKGVLPYICAAPKSTQFFSRFGLNSVMVFEGIQLRWTYLSFQFQMNKKESICQFEMDFKTSFCWCSNPSNDFIISAYARSENGFGF